MVLDLSVASIVIELYIDSFFSIWLPWCWVLGLQIGLIVV